MWKRISPATARFPCCPRAKTGLPPQRKSPGMAKPPGESHDAKRMRQRNPCGGRSCGRAFIGRRCIFWMHRRPGAHCPAFGPQSWCPGISSPGAIGLRRIGCCGRSMTYRPSGGNCAWTRRNPPWRHWQGSRRGISPCMWAFRSVPPAASIAALSLRQRKNPES